MKKVNISNWMLLKYEGKFEDRALTKGTNFSAGLDLVLNQDAYIEPLGTVNTLNWHTTGTSIDSVYDGSRALLVMARSSMAQRGLMLANSVGLIDADYRDEIKVAFFNFSPNAVEIPAGSRVAQLVCVKIEHNDETPLNAERIGGFGSTGI